MSPDDKLIGFSYGDVENPKPDDPRYEIENDAMEAAVDESINDHVIGVWNDETGELLHIVYQGIIYSS